MGGESRDGTVVRLDRSSWDRSSEKYVGMGSHPGIVVQRSVYTAMVSSNANARFCLALGVVVMVKLDSSARAPLRRQVLRTMVLSSVNRPGIAGDFNS